MAPLPQPLLSIVLVEGEISHEGWKPASLAMVAACISSQRLVVLSVFCVKAYKDQSHSHSDVV